MARQAIALDDLIIRFVGKRVRISHPGCCALPEVIGKCTAITASRSRFDFRITRRRKSQVYGVIPDAMTETAIEGNLDSLAAARRRIQIV